MAIAHQRQLVAELGKSRNRLGHEILMRRVHDRQLEAEPASDLMRIGAGRNDDHFAGDAALVGLDHPFAAYAAHAGDARVPGDLRAALPRALGERKGRA